MTDELTKLPNRRHVDQYYEKVWDWARRDCKSLSVVMCDIDRFKQINDTCGHAAGDMVLENVAQILKKVLKRKTDFAARIGGEEFVIVLYDMAQENARDLCERIRYEIERMGSLEYHGSHVRPVTLSLGVSSQQPTAGSTAHQLLMNADAALYQAKRCGRNRTVLFEPGA
jgi:diguanylate cyclase (GGDEF)-like protein